MEIANMNGKQLLSADKALYRKPELFMVGLVVDLTASGSRNQAENYSNGADTCTPQATKSPCTIP